MKEKHLCGYHVYPDTIDASAYEDIFYVERWLGRTEDWTITELECMVAIVAAANSVGSAASRA